MFKVKGDFTKCVGSKVQAQKSRIHYKEDSINRFLGG